MPFVTITPYTSGQVPTKAQFDQIRDNLNSLRHGNDLLAQLYLNVDQSVADSTVAFISWTSIVGSQVGGLWSAGNPTRLVNNSGSHAIFTAVLNVEWLTSTTGERSIGLQRNSDGMFWTLPSNGANQGGGNQSGMIELFLSNGDYVQAWVRHTNGSTIGIHGGSADRTSIFMSLAGEL